MSGIARREAILGAVVPVVLHPHCGKHRRYASQWSCQRAARAFTPFRTCCAGGISAICDWHAALICKLQDFSTACDRSAQRHEMRTMYSLPVAELFERICKPFLH